MRATPQKVEDALASIRSNLIRIIQNWGRSGQGEGAGMLAVEKSLMMPKILSYLTRLL
jgi:hypothetical protein